jgi:hypothetical protein
MVRKKTLWAYHATDPKNLPAIKRKGLVPYPNFGLLDVEPDAPDMVYFDYDEKHVQGLWGEGSDECPDWEDCDDWEPEESDKKSAILRFPEPDDAENAEYKWGTEGSVTYKKVPPSVIEFKDAAGKWVKLSEATFVKSRKRRN